MISKMKIALGQLGTYHVRSYFLEKFQQKSSYLLEQFWQISFYTPEQLCNYFGK